MIPTSVVSHYNNPYWQPHGFHAPPAAAPHPVVAPGPIYINAGRGFKRAPRRIVWFALGSAATLWWINSPRHSCSSSSWCESRSYSLSPPSSTVTAPESNQAVVAENKDRDFQGRRFGGWRRRREDEELSRRVMEERWKADSEKMARSADQAKEKGRDFASQRLEEMLAALTELKKDLKPSSPPTSSSTPPEETPAFFI
ncbi:hypothetical protein BDY24DRAFT_70506 [Mrakia frigida]|uniref:uncharacterized protein n=1 Tax=Mrakia frigida TaxID=29902 RepID=UPI003FCBFADB